MNDAAHRTDEVAAASPAPEDPRPEAAAARSLAPDAGADDQPEVVDVEIPPEMDRMRLDAALARLLPDYSRTRLADWIERGHVAQMADDPTQGAITPTVRTRVSPGQTFVVVLPEPEDAEPEPQDIPLDILDEDEHLLVIYKPPGLVVHPATGHADGTLVNALLFHCAGRLSSIGGVRRPGIVHRLDKDTSGLMVVAKTDKAHQGLKAQFQDRSLSRSYRALVVGLPSPASGRVEGAIGRKPHDRFRMAVVAEERGKAAATRYRLLQAFGPHAGLVECHLETGRTHQVRVHMAHLGHPLIGDPLYLPSPRVQALPAPMAAVAGAFPRQALHARTLKFLHPVTGKEHTYTREQPQDMDDLAAALAHLSAAALTSS